jgi:signal peptidase I
VSAFIIIFLYQPVRVEGTSMLPMLEDQDRLFINKIAYRVGEIHRGDVVVFLYPHDHEKSYIKRVIGLPGDAADRSWAGHRERKAHEGELRSAAV